MPVYRLPEEVAFPHPTEAEPGGLLAVGGDLRPERLLTAYANGIFPWYSEDEPILWFSPDPRFVLRPHRLLTTIATRPLGIYLIASKLSMVPQQVRPDQWSLVLAKKREVFPAATILRLQMTRSLTLG